jgi:hypothetical protein
MEPHAEAGKDGAAAGGEAIEEPPAVGAGAEGRAIAVPEIVGEAHPGTIPDNSRAAKIPTGNRFRACALMNSLPSPRPVSLATVSEAQVAPGFAS